MVVRRLLHVAIVQIVLTIRNQCVIILILFVGVMEYKPHFLMALVGQMLGGARLVVSISLKRVRT